MVGIAGVIGGLLWHFNDALRTEFKMEKEFEFSFAKLWLYLSIAYIIGSFRFGTPIPADHIGLRLLFGKPFGELAPGLPLVPLFFCTMDKDSSLVQQKEFPADPEHIYRGEMKDAKLLPDNMKPPMRIPFRNSITKDEAENVFGRDHEYNLPDPHDPARTLTFEANVPDDGISLRRVTAEAYPVVRWRIKNYTAFKLNIGTINEVNRQMEDELFSVLTRICQKISLAQAIQNQQWLNAILFKSVLRRIKGDPLTHESDEWGIELEAVFIKYFYLHHDLNKSIGSVAEASFTANATVISAEATKTRLEKEGAGAAAAEHKLQKAKIAGRGEGIAALVKKTKLSPEAAAALTVSHELSQGGNLVVMGNDGLNNLVGAGMAIAKNLSDQKKGKDAEE